MVRIVLGVIAGFFAWMTVWVGKENNGKERGSSRISVGEFYSFGSLQVSRKNKG